MDATDLDGLFHHFDHKISNVCDKLALINLYDTKSKEHCLETNHFLGDIQLMLSDVNSFLEQQEQLLESQTKRCTDMIDLINDQSDYIDSKLSTLQCNNKSTSKANVSNKNQITRKDDKAKPSNTKNNNLAGESSGKHVKKVPPIKKDDVASGDIQNSKSTVKTKPSDKPRSADIQLVPQVQQLTKSEFDSIPSYMLGRLSLESLNEFVAAFNTTLDVKYKFINSYAFQNSSEGDYKRFQTYKSHENAETKDIYFCIVNDVKELSSMKNDSTIRKALTCLRHCKRIKEIRGNPPKLIRYGLVN